MMSLPAMSLGDRFFMSQNEWDGGITQCPWAKLDLETRSLGSKATNLKDIYTAQMCPLTSYHSINFHAHPLC